MAKVVIVDSKNRKSVSDFVYLADIEEENANMIADSWNATFPNEDSYATVRPDNYKPY